MSILDLLYQPTAKDRLAGLAPRRYIERATIAAAANPLSTGIFGVVPADTVRLIMGVAVQTTAGAGQPARSVVLNAFVDNNGIEIASFECSGGGSYPAGIQISHQSQRIEALLLAGESLGCTCIFGGGINVNAIFVGVWGYDFPRANIQR